MSKLLTTGMLASILILSGLPTSTATANPNFKSIAEQTAKIDINKATIEQLTSLQGIGKAKAKAIVEYRAKINGFTHIDDLKEVKGIGNKLVQQLKNQISV
jgi:competence protein ComEA